MGTVLGTPSYMAPEQMRGEPADGRADLWAAGVMLYEMLAGRGPFAGAANAFEVMRGALASEPAPVSSLVPGLPTAIDSVLRRALARRREDRFQEAGEFARELTKAAASSGEGVDVDLALEPADAGLGRPATGPPPQKL
jgi:serine/threonine-protein kinase